MKVLVISGFLGAGKTTLIQELARRTGEDFVVYENELAQADLDAQVLQGPGGLSVWESTENCICCTGSQDFATTVLTISNTLDPAYLVVEPTGAARLSSVLENLQKVAYERIEILPPVCVVDGAAWASQSSRFADLLQDQVASATHVFISKTDHATPQEIEQIMDWAAAHNPQASVESHPIKAIPDTWFFSLLQDAQTPNAAPQSTTTLPSQSAHASASTQPELETFSLEGVTLRSEGDLLVLLEQAIHGALGDIIRAKGMLACGQNCQNGQNWVCFDLVDGSYSITGGEKIVQPAAVFIGQNLNRAKLRRAFVLPTDMYVLRHAPIALTPRR
ncbi:MAG: CobW family GTP-binding protein [Atopobiaceae bacterium]